MGISGVSEGYQPAGFGQGSTRWEELQKAISAFEKDPSNGNLLEKVLHLDAEMQNSKHCTPQQLAALMQIHGGAISANAWAKGGHEYESEVQRQLDHVNAGVNRYNDGLAG